MKGVIYNPNRKRKPATLTSTRPSYFR